MILCIKDLEMEKLHNDLIVSRSIVLVLGTKIKCETPRELTSVDGSRS